MSWNIFSSLFCILKMKWTRVMSWVKWGHKTRKNNNYAPRTLIELFSTIQKSLTATATFDPQKTLDFGSLFYGGKNAHCGATLSRRTFFWDSLASVVALLSVLHAGPFSRENVAVWQGKHHRRGWKGNLNMQRGR